jgi:hypothetical protein
VQPCALYANGKGPRQQLFAAAAALYAATGAAAYRAAAEDFWEPSAFLFFNNWNNVYPQVSALDQRWAAVAHAARGALCRDSMTVGHIYLERDLPLGAHRSTVVHSPPATSSHDIFKTLINLHCNQGKLEKSCHVQGVAILAGEPAPVGARYSAGYWRGQLRAAAQYYSDCSNTGAAGNYCECAAPPRSRSRGPSSRLRQK